MSWTLWQLKVNFYTDLRGRLKVFDGVEKFCDFWLSCGELRFLLKVLCASIIANFAIFWVIN
jgi:hypothetical protein